MIIAVRPKIRRPKPRLPLFRSSTASSSRCFFFSSGMKAHLPRCPISVTIPQIKPVCNFFAAGRPAYGPGWRRGPMETLSPPRSHRKPRSHHNISAPPNQPAGHLANPTNYHLRRKEKYVIIERTVKNLY